MKKLVSFALCIIISILTFSCNSKSGHLADERRKAEIIKHDSIALQNRAEQAFNASLLVEGDLFLEGTMGETSPSITFRITKSLDFVLIESHSISDESGNGIPLQLALSLKEIIKEYSVSKNDFAFRKDEKGRVWYKFATDSENTNPLDEASNFLKFLGEKTGWKIKTYEWGTV